MPAITRTGTNFHASLCLCSVGHCGAVVAVHTLHTCSPTLRLEGTRQGDRFGGNARDGDVNQSRRRRRHSRL